MQYIYHFFVYLYGIIVKIASLRSAKAAMFVKGRQNWQNKAQLHAQQKFLNKELVWIHCASLGEFEQGRPVLELLRKENPDMGILLTFFSPSGYEVHQNYAGADLVMYLPLDTPTNAADFLDIFKPKLALFVKYEFWYCYLMALTKRNIPTLYFSAIFQPRHSYFKWYGGFFRKMLRTVTMFFVQNEESKTLLESIGIANAQIAGDTRFDRAFAIANTPFEDAILSQFIKDKKVIVAGSTWPQDDLAIAKAFKYLSNDYVLLIAPHNIDAGSIHKAHEAFRQWSPLRYTNCVLGTQTLSADNRVMIIDTIGKLAYVYRWAHCVWIGGGFRKTGIHNTLEAAVYGKPIFIGPYYQKFQEAKDLIACGAARSFDEDDLPKELLLAINNEKGLTTMGEQALEYASQQKGATTKIVNYVVLKYFSTKA